MFDSHLVLMDAALCQPAHISYNGFMVSPDEADHEERQADREEQLADVQEATEQRMRSSADVLRAANWYMSVLTSSAHAPGTTDIKPNSFKRVLARMRTPVRSTPDLRCVAVCTRC
jgi:hypothetical protein